MEIYRIFNTLEESKNEIINIKATNHLVPFYIMELSNGKIIVIIHAIWRNSIRYKYFIKNYRPLVDYKLLKGAKEL